MSEVREPAGINARLLFAGEPGPRALQGVFAMLVALDFALRAVASRDPLGVFPMVALGLTLLVTAGSALVPWDALPPWAVAVLPITDTAAIGLSRLSEEVSGVGVLMVLPAYWLGRLLGRRGAIVIVVATVALVAVPQLAHLGWDGATVSRSVLLPAVAGWVALAIGAGVELVGAQQTETDRRSAELTRALHVIDHQRRVADAILDSVDVGLVLLDREGNYQAMNRRHADFMRLAYPDGHAGRAGQLGSVYDEEGLRRLTREEMPTYRAMVGEELDDCRIWVGDDPLTWRALSVSARTVRDDDGRFAGAALAYNDVTDFMRALRVKDEFVASVSHELRTPLTSIRGYCDILLDRDDLPEGADRQLAVVIRNAERLGRLVADLLHTAQFDLGPVHVVRTRGDLAGIVRDAVAAAAPAARAAQLELCYEGPEQLVTMLDQMRMRQVVDNLVSNAIKYTPPLGRVDVRLSVDANRIELEVADTGIGIEAADRDRLFTRFFRARHAEEQSIQGVGLGLSITKSIVESHGGRVEVDSEVGRGSAFRVRVPVVTG